MVGEASVDDLMVSPGCPPLLDPGDMHEVPLGNSRGHEGTRWDFETVANGSREGGAVESERTFAGMNPVIANYGDNRVRISTPSP